MKQAFVAAVVVVFLCCCLSCGNGNKLIDEARKNLRKRYAMLYASFEAPNALRPQSTVYMYLNEVRKKKNTWPCWLQGHIGYSLEHLNNPPDSSMSEDELKLATEYHLWQSAWYYVRFIALHKAAERESHVADGYPRTRKCRDAALIARAHSQHHKKIYSQYYQVLGKKARQYIMKEFKFPNYIDSNQHIHQNVGVEAILKVRLYLEKQILRLMKKKRKMNWRSAKSYKSIQVTLTPARMVLNDVITPNLPDSFPVEDLSQPPDKASRVDREFLEVAWLFNRYRSLWYEIRRNELLKFLRHWEQCLTPEFIERVKGGIEFTTMSFQQYEMLYVKYYNVFVIYREDQKQKQSRGRGKQSRMTVLEGTHETAENHCFHEDLEGVASNSPELDASGAQPELDLSLAPPVIQNARELPMLDLNVALLETDETKENAIEMDSIPPKRLKLTESEDDQSRRRYDSVGVHQSPLERCISEHRKPEESSYSSYNIQLFHFF